MERSDRMAVIIVPREPLVDWINSVTPDETVWADDFSDRANVYFIPRYETLDEAEEYVQENFDEIFRNELAEWFEDESSWPAKRTFDMFNEWFDVIFDVMVFEARSSRHPHHQN
ncbi:MAG: hypothetical protein WCI27_00825 [Candidatus Omnitrophota bacterium]